MRRWISTIFAFFWARPLIFALIFVGGFFYTQEAGAQAQRPDLRIIKATFDGLNLHVEYVNATGVGYPRTRYEVGFQWYDASGSAVGTRHWLNVPEVERGGVSILDNKYRIDLTYRGRDGRNYNRTLAEFLHQRPDQAEELRVMVDDGDRVSETDESNNVARLRISLPDLQFVNAKFLAPNQLEIAYRNINPSPISVPFRIGFTWAQESGTHLTPTRFMNVLEPAAGTTRTEILSRTDVSYINDRGQQFGDRLDWYLERRPGNATRLKITLDDAGTVREANEQNNLVSVRPDLPDLVVREARLADGQLSLVYGNAGEGYIKDLVSRILFQWRNASGQPVGSPRWSRFAQMDPKQVFKVNAERFDVEYAVPGTKRTTTQRLAAYVSARPTDATRLDITIDDEQLVLEANENNNTATVTPPPPSPPDFTITDATLTADALTFTARNLGPGAAGQFISFWFEWVNQAGGRVAALVWNDVPTALAPGQFLNFDAARAQFRRERPAGGLSDPITFAELMASAPESATHLKVHVDGPSTYAEPNEQNNVLLLPKPIPPQPDLAIADLRVGPGNVITFGAQNLGDAATGGGVSLWFHGATAGGVQVGPLYWYDVPEILAGQTQPFNSAGITAHSQDGDAQLSAVFTGPSEATHFKILLDGPGRIQEKNEGNNMALLERPRPPLPDIVIENAALTNDRLTYTVVNRGNASVRVAAYNVRFEWLRADGQLTQGHPYPPAYLPSGSNLITGAPGESLRFSSDPPDARYEWLFRSITDPPQDAVRLRLTADPTTPPFEESNEENNVVILERPRPTLPEGGVLPDFTIENAALSYASRGQGMQVGQLTYTIRNRGQGTAPHAELWIGHRWIGGNGQPIGDTRYMHFDTALQPNGTIMFDSAAQRLDTRGWAVRDMVPYPPLGATHFELTIDPWGYYREPAGAAPNTTRVDIPRPDFTFSRAQYAEGRLTWELMNNGAGIPLGRRDGYQWLTDFPIRHEWLNTAGTVLATQDTFVRGTITNGVFSTFDSNTLPVGHPFRAFFATPPAGAMQMRIMVDPERVQPETDENNNTIISAAAGDEPEPEEPPPEEEPEEEPIPEPPPPPKLPDLTITKETLDGAALRYLYHNNGEGAAEPAVSFWYEWVDGQGRRISKLYWINVSGMAGGSKREGNQLLDISTLEGEQGKIKLGELIYAPPAGAYHLKFTIDGPNAHKESNEQNNSVLLPVLRTDFTITNAEFRNDFPWFKYHNRGNLGHPEGKKISFWFEWVDGRGARLGDLHWLEVDPPLILSARSASLTRSTSFDSATTVFSAKGAATLTAFLNSAPSGATQLKITIDGPNAYAESDEDNNTVLLKKLFKLGEEQKLPDLALTGVTRVGGVVKVTITNGTPDTLRAPLLQFKWLDAKGATLQTSPISYWQHETIVAGKTGDFTIEYEKWREDGVIYFLKHPPAGAVALLTTIDPENKLKESDEDNNALRIAFSPTETAQLPDLAFTGVFVPPGSDRLVIGFENAGKAEAPIWGWQVRWLDAQGQPVGETYRGIIPGLKPNWRYGFGNDSQDLAGKPWPLGEFLRQIPVGATRIELTIDPDNKVVEGDKSNNRQYFEVANFPPSLRAPKAVPELKLTLTAEVIKAKSVAAASPFATAGFVMALAALISGAYMIHGHTGARSGPAGFFEVFPMLFTSPHNSYMFLRQCGIRECVGAHFDRHTALKRMTRASLVVTLLTGFVKISMALALTAFTGPTELVSAAIPEASLSDAVRATLTAQNTGSAAAVGITLRLACPSGTSWTSTRLNDKNDRRDVSKGLEVPDLAGGAAHRLVVVCKIDESAANTLKFVGEAQIKALGDRRLYSNTVEVAVIKPPEEKQPPAEKPDLTIEGVGFLPLVDIIEKDRAPLEAIFSGMVSNKGTKDSGAFRARVRVDHGSNGTWDAVSPKLVEVSSLAPGSEILVKLPLEWVAPVGNYTFEICVDPGRNIYESDEYNNCETDRFTLKVGEEPAQEEELVE